jgi:hypothetical protein
MNKFSVKKGQTGGMTISPNPERNWLALNSIGDPQVDLWDWRSGQPPAGIRLAGWDHPVMGSGPGMSASRSPCEFANLD